MESVEVGDGSWNATELAIAAREGLEWELCRVYLRAKAIEELRNERNDK